MKLIDTFWVIKDTSSTQTHYWRHFAWIVIQSLSVNLSTLTGAQFGAQIRGLWKWGCKIPFISISIISWWNKITNIKLWHCFLQFTFN